MCQVVSNGKDSCLTGTSGPTLRSERLKVLIGGFVFWAAFWTDDIDDDDNGPDDGMLTPVYAPSR